MAGPFASKAALVFAALAVVGVFLPWYSVSASLPGVLEASASLNGTEGEFKGAIVLVLAGLAAAAALFAAMEASIGPLKPQALLVAATLLLGVGAFLAITDLLRDMPASFSRGLTAGKGVGMYVTFASCAIGALFALMAVRAP